MSNPMCSCGHDVYHHDSDQASSWTGCTAYEAGQYCSCRKSPADVYEELVEKYEKKLAAVEELIKQWWNMSYLYEDELLGTSYGDCAIELECVLEDESFN